MSPTKPPRLQWSKEQSRLCCSAMHSTQAVLTSASVMQNDGYIRVADAISVKLSKVGTMLQRDCDAKSHVIACTTASVHWEASKRAASSEWLYAARNGPPRTQWSFKGDNHGGQPLHATKEICNAKRDVELQGGTEFNCNFVTL